MKNKRKTYKKQRFVYQFVHYFANFSPKGKEKLLFSYDGCTCFIVCSFILLICLYAKKLHLHFNKRQLKLFPQFGSSSQEELKIVCFSFQLCKNQDNYYNSLSRKKTFQNQHRQKRHAFARISIIRDLKNKFGPPIRPHILQLNPCPDS